MLSANRIFIHQAATNCPTFTGGDFRRKVSGGFRPFHRGIHGGALAIYQIPVKCIFHVGRAALLLKQPFLIGFILSEKHFRRAFD